MAEIYEKTDEETSDVYDIEEEANSVELQLEKLTAKINELEKKVAVQEIEKKTIQNQFNVACHELESARYEKESLRKSGNLKPKYITAQKWIEPQHVAALSAIEHAEELRNLLEEERAKNNEIRREYENHLNLIRKKCKKQLITIKKIVLQQVEFLVRKYRHLANEAICIAKKEREKVVIERQKCRKLAQTACVNFEADLKDRTKKALQEYRNLAQMAHEAAQKERNQLRSKCEQLGRAVDVERQQFEAHIVREAEKRVCAYRHGFAKLKNQIDEERNLFDEMILEISQQVEEECKNYENFLLRSLVQLFLENGLDINEEKIKHFLQSEKMRIEKQKQEQEEDVQQLTPPAADSSSSRTKLGSSVKVRYGFQALSNAQNS